MATQSPSQNDNVEPVETIDAGRRRRFRFGAASGSRPPIGQVINDLNWRLLLLIGVIGGILWTVLLAQNNTATFFAGLLPVAGGIWVGRKISGHVGWHAGMLSLITVAAALVATAVMIVTNIVPNTFLPQVVALGIMALLPFPAFGVFTSFRSEQRNRLARQETDRRGGKLDKPGRVKSIEELQSLSLPQLGGYVADLFRKHDFLVKDFQFGRDNSIEFDMRHDDQPWIIRVTVDDKVKQGTALQFHQRLREDGNPRGVLITSMEFQDATLRWAKDKPIALIDGATLLTMHE